MPTGTGQTITGKTDNRESAADMQAGQAGAPSMQGETVPQQHFSRSRSQVQGAYLDQGAKPEAGTADPFSRQEAQKPKGEKKGFFEHRLGPEHLFGTLMAGVYIYRWSKGVKSALPNELVNPRQNGIRSVGDAGRALARTEKPFLLAGMVGSLLINIGIALSARGAEVPEGDNVFQRMVNALKHPNQSAMQVNAILMGGTLTAIASSKLKSGIQGMRGNAKGSLAYTEAMASAISGVTYLVSNPLIFLGIMGIKRGDSKSKNAQDKPDAGNTGGQEHPVVTEAGRIAASAADPAGEAAPLTAEEKSRLAEMEAGLESDAAKQQPQQDKGEPQPFGKSKSSIFSLNNLKAAFEPYSPKNLKASFGYAIKHDKLGLTARTLAVIAETGFIVEGMMRMRKVSAGVYNDVSARDREAIMAKGRAARNFGIMGVAVTLGQAAYTYGRLYIDSQKELSPDNAAQMAR